MAIEKPICIFFLLIRFIWKADSGSDYCAVLPTTPYHCTHNHTAWLIDSLDLTLDIAAGFRTYSGMVLCDDGDGMMDASACPSLVPSLQALQGQLGALPASGDSSLSLSRAASWRPGVTRQPSLGNSPAAQLLRAFRETSACLPYLPRTTTAAALSPGKPRHCIVRSHVGVWQLNSQQCHATSMRDRTTRSSLYTRTREQRGSRRELPATHTCNLFTFDHIFDFFVIISVANEKRNNQKLQSPASPAYMPALPACYSANTLSLWKQSQWIPLPTPTRESGWSGLQSFHLYSHKRKKIYIWHSTSDKQNLSLRPLLSHATFCARMAIK